MRRHLDRSGEGLGKALEAAAVASGLGKLIEAAFCLLDLILRPLVGGGVVGGIHHLLADQDQGPANGKVVDGAAIVRRVDDRRGFGGKAGEILARGQSGAVQVRWPKSLY